MSFDRRSFLATSAAAVATAALPRFSFADHHKEHGDHNHSHHPFEISLAQWSLHKMLKAGELDAADFPKFTQKTFGINAVEYVNQFYFDHAENPAYWAELRKKCDDLGVKSVLIMVDREGNLGDPDNTKRAETVQNHVKWLKAAQALGCHSIRVNAGSSGSWEQQRDLAADGLRRLGQIGDDHGLNVLVENHGGLSSNGEWLASVMEYADHPRVGTLPDFGNFWIKRPRNGEEGEKFDNYKGTELLMPYAKAVSAKAYGFDEAGNESTLDYERLMKIVLDAGYHGHVGIEWEGGDPDEVAGVKLTKVLLEKLQKQLA